MSGPYLHPPPSVDELASLARLVATYRPRLLPVFLCSLCRSTRAVEACRALEPSDDELAALRQLDPWGAKLIAASRKGTAWIRERARRDDPDRSRAKPDGES